jgi:uncharacterized Fe-S cluster-containing radical SAM superfamily protein
MDFGELRSRYLEQPHEVSIETLALCNARCTFCPYPTLDRIGEKMSLELVYRLIEEMRAFREPFFVSPFKVNEPLLDGRLSEFCHEIIARCPAAKLRLFTNGSPLTDANVEWIAELDGRRLAHLWVSLNSCDPDEYEKLMGIPYSHVAKRLDALHEKVETGYFLHDVVLSRVGSGRVYGFRESDNERDLEFIRVASMRWPHFVPLLIKRDGWLGAVEPGNPDIPRSPCGRWFELSILATGTASLCCMDGKGEYPVGDVHHQTLLEIYNQPRLKAWRQSALTRQGINPCERCTY